MKNSTKNFVLIRLKPEVYIDNRWPELLLPVRTEVFENLIDKGPIPLEVHTAEILNYIENAELSEKEREDYILLLSRVSFSTAMYLGNLNKHNVAVAYFDLTHTIEPNISDFTVNYSVCLEYLDKPDDAYAVLEEYISNGNDFEPNIWKDAIRLNEFFENYQRALELMLYFKEKCPEHCDHKTDAYIESLKLRASSQPMKSITYDFKYFILAKELNYEFKKLLKEKQLHFRGNFSSFSLISINNETAEKGFANLNSKEDAIKILNSELKIQKPQRNTPEKVLQAWIINYAVNNLYKLPFGDNFNFITSELVLPVKESYDLSIKKRDIRNDILAIDKEGNLLIIELKSIRVNFVKQQTIDFEKVINYEKSLFMDFVKQLTGQTWSGKCKKVIVWPFNENSRKVDPAYSDIIEIGYIEKGNDFEFKE